MRESWDFSFRLATKTGRERRWAWAWETVVELFVPCDVTEKQDAGGQWGVSGGLAKGNRRRKYRQA